MKRSQRTAGRAPRTAARALALAAMLAASGIAAGAASASGPLPTGQRAATATLAYTCRFPSGPKPVSVQIAAVLPVAAVAGKPIQPSDARVTVTVPPAAVTDVATWHVRAVTAATWLTLAVTQGGTPARARWPRLATPAAPVPRTGNLILRASGAVPSMIPRAPGDLTVTAAGLRVVLTPSPPAGSSAGSQTITPTLVLRCLPDPGQRTALATVPVAGQPVPSPSPAAGRTSQDASHFCPPQPPGGLQLNPKFPLPTPPPGSTVLHPPPVAGCAFVVGYSDVRKLNGAALVGPGLTNLALNVRVVTNTKPPTYVEFDSAGELDFKPCATCPFIHALPPARATFLGFGFVPVSATMQLTEVGTTNVISVGTQRGLRMNTVFSEVVLRVSDVTVNGVPLDVGQHCQSATPILLTLTGNPNGIPPYSLQGGGPLTGSIDIPKFQGCGVSENLDNLFTASISGPGNFVLLTQGAPCFTLGGGSGCPPVKPTPLRSVSG